MSEPTKKTVTPLSIAVDVVLCAAFAVLIFNLVSSHVPSRNASTQLVVGGATTACMTVVFWLCIQMFRVVLRGQRESSRK
jgi:hypothetical protein